MTAEQIRQLRKRLHLTQKQLAVRLTVARETVAHWERGARAPLRVHAEAMRRMAGMVKL